MGPALLLHQAARSDDPDGSTAAAVPVDCASRHRLGLSLNGDQNAFYHMPGAQRLAGAVAIWGSLI